MKTPFVADGAERVGRAGEASLRLAINERYASQLSHAGFLKTCYLHWRMYRDFRNERLRLPPAALPSPYALYSKTQFAKF